MMKVCKVAGALQAEALYLLTDVPGIRKQDEWLTRVSTEQISQLVADEVVTGGMLPKLASAQVALKAGVKAVFINNSIVSQGTELYQQECLQLEA